MAEIASNGTPMGRSKTKLASIVAASSSGQNERLPVAVCWSHSSGVNFDDPGALVDVQSYERGKSGKLVTTEESSRSRRESELYSQDNESGDIFSKLVTRATRQDVPGSLVCASGNMDYVGESHPTMSANMLLGVYDKATKEIQLVPFGDVFPRMKILETEVEPGSNESPVPLRTPVSQFSSKAKRRRHDERTSSAQLLRHNTDRLVEHEDDGDISHLIEDQKDTEIDPRLGEDIRPQANFEATEPADLYNWTEIVSADVLTALKPLAEEVSQSIPSAVEDWKKSRRFTNYVLKMLTGLTKGDPNRTGKVSKMLLINYLLTMYGKPTRAMPGPHIVGKGVPDSVAAFLIDKFTVPSLMQPKKRTVSEICKSRIMVHILLIALNLESFVADVTGLMAELMPRDRKSITHLSLVIGARLMEKSAKKGDTFVLALKHPWNFAKRLNNTPRKKKR